MRIGATIGASGVPATTDLDDIAYYGEVRCAKPAVMGAGGVVTVGRTGVTKQITQLLLCETADVLNEVVLTPLDGYTCQTIHTASLPSATTADTLTASAEFDSDWLDLNKFYYVLATMRVSNSNTRFYAASTITPLHENNARPAWECIQLADVNAFECVVASAPFRYAP